jgi:hypothetical protein
MTSIIGHEKIISFFEALIARNALAQSYCFVGKDMVGKKTVATHLAAQLLQALSPDGGFTILDGESRNWGQALQDRLRDIGVLSVGKPTPPLARESLQHRLRGSMDDAALERLAQTYDGLPDLSGVVEDANIRRLCSALTASGFETRYSCEGHGYELAHVKFVCTPEQKGELKALLDASKDRLKEEWTIIEDHMDKTTLRYRLQPTHQDSRSTRHHGVIADLDVIGMLVLQKFAQRKIGNV